MSTRSALVCSLLWAALAACGSADPERDIAGGQTQAPSGSTVPDNGMEAQPPPTSGMFTQPPTDEPMQWDTPIDTVPPASTDTMEPTLDEPIPPPEPDFALDECGLDTGFPGDEFCILPPPPDQGFQVHIGPDDYDNPDTSYVLLPGEEKTDDFSAVSSNTEEAYFYYRQYRLRPTVHHAILSTRAEGDAFGVGRRIGTANTSQDYPSGGIIAPENQGVGSPIAERSPINVSLHALNVLADTPAIRELWVNFWYRDAAEVTEPANQVFEIGSASFAIQPLQETTLGPYTCNIPEEGRLLWLYGHRHANNERFTVWRVRGEQRDIIYEGYDWEEPLLLEYNSLVTNDAPNRDAGIEGGWSGILSLLPGDRLEWECHVVNQHNSVLRFTNQTYLGEMCIIDAEMVGTNCE